ncbi:MAG: hypothetical protein HWN65_01565 [Candidatus Helarchaeota archaeon]|nr:hypothetical protein [Candidatus Helarchaeota archaeon]
MEFESVYNLNNFLSFIHEFIEQFKAGPKIGDYSYKRGKEIPDLYGSSDILMTLYAINELKLTENQRLEWIKRLQTFQDPKTGWFKEAETLHFKEHSTAYCIAALNLIGGKPAFPLKFMKKMNTKRKLWRWLRWQLWSLIWSTSHRGPGVAAALAMTGEAPAGWFDWFFEWCNKKVDPKTGYWRLGFIHKLGMISKDEMAGAFHFYYIYEYFKHPLPYPKQIVDWTLRLQHNNGLWDKNVPYCIDLDGVYSLARASKAANNYRKRDVERALEKTLHTIVTCLNDKEFLFKNYRNSHRLVGALAAVAEIQDYMPDRLDTPKKWRNQLDYAPYI